MLYHLFRLSSSISVLYSGNTMHYIPVNCQIFNFYLACFSASPFEFFLSFFIVFITAVPVLSFAFVLHFQAACMLCMWRVCRCFSLCLSLGTRAPSSKWDSEPVNRSSASAVLAPPVCRQFPLLPTELHFPLNFTVSKSPVHNPLFTPAHNSPVFPRSTLSFRYFVGGIFHFQLSQIQIFRGAHTNTSVPHAANLGSSTETKYNSHFGKYWILD